MIAAAAGKLCWSSPAGAQPRSAGPMPQPAALPLVVLAAVIAGCGSEAPPDSAGTAADVATEESSPTEVATSTADGSCDAYAEVAREMIAVTDELMATPDIRTTPGTMATLGDLAIDAHDAIGDDPALASTKDELADLVRTIDWLLEGLPETVEPPYDASRYDRLREVVGRNLWVAGSAIDALRSGADVCDTSAADAEQRRREFLDED